MKFFKFTVDRTVGIFFFVLLAWIYLTDCCTITSSKLPKFCHQFEESKCEIKWNSERLTCTGNINYDEDYRPIKTVILCSWSLDYINPEEILKNFPNIRKLGIHNGNVTEFLTNFPQSKYLQSLILVNLSISEIRPTLFTSLENLKLLDLSCNNLKHIPPDVISQNSLTKVILTDNPWDCSLDVKWILNKSINSKIFNRNLIKCGNKIFPGKPIYLVMSLIRKMEKDCPKNICHCTMNNIVWDTDQKYLIPVITVNCSDQGLRELPPKLPINTTSLLLYRNNISNLTPLIRNKVYSNIADIYLDNNKIKSIDVLEGALWLKTFRVLSLRGNELTQLPIYALDNAFEKNTNMAKIYLGDNPWKCDCLFTPEFQHLLIKYRPVIKDQNDIRCAEQEDNDNSLRKIATLSTNSVCREPETGLNPLDVLSTVLGTLIIFILGKLIYDYWAFKKTGKLPWIVTKIP